jgi:RNA polymerase sigma factor for flagellar operon FliA
MAAMPHATHEPWLANEPTLWAQWHGQGNEAARDVLVHHYTAWARKLAKAVFMRVRGRSTDWPDFVQNASVGMIEAMASYDPGRGVPFQAYARRRVRGAVFNGLRALTATHLVAASDLGWEERHDSILDEHDADPVERLIRIVSALGLGHAISFHAEVAQASGSTPYDEAAKHQLRERIDQQLRKLPEKERLILQLHYLQHMAFVDIARTLALSKGRISQLHRQGLDRLRLRMHADAWQYTF